MKHRIIKAFLRSKSGLFALIVLCITILVAIFAYPLATDKTPDANNIIVELAAKPIGFQQQILLLPKANVQEHTSKWSAFWLGKPSVYSSMPITCASMVGDTLTVAHYIDEGITESYSFSVSHTWGQTYQMDDFPYIIQKKFLLGTDRYGRDIYSRLILGSRVSLTVGIIAATLSVFLGILFGALAGWFGGWVDNVIMWFINLLWAIPTLLLVFAITLTIGKGFWEIFIAIGLTSWVSAARLIRGQVMQLKNLDYITAAKLLGFSDFRIILKHILPNIWGPILVIAAANFASAILIEAGLSFLGFGVQPPTPSWGTLIKEHYNFLITDNPLPALLPGFAIFLLVLSFNIIGNTLRDAVDVKS
jgi:ABC-type dipeptide/oligopeptide/nickel transport system permease subunit